MQKYKVVQSLTHFKLQKLYHTWVFKIPFYRTIETVHKGDPASRSLLGMWYKKHKIK